MKAPFLLRNYAKSRLKNKAILHINPTKITHYADVPFYQDREMVRKKYGKTLGNFLLHTFYIHHSSFAPLGDWDTMKYPVEELKTYSYLKDLWSCKDDFKQSLWYQEALNTLMKKGYYQHKKTKVTSLQALDALFQNSLLMLLSSMKIKGYLPHLNHENPRVIITREGELLKSRKGRHRFCAAKIVETPEIIVEIDNIHPLFLEKIDGGFSRQKLENLKNALSYIEVKYH